MAWLQSSFTSHQLLGDSSSSSHRKGFKSGSCNNSSDPDKSDTPLLHDSPHSPEVENTSSGWLKSSSSGDKKQNSTNNTSKSSFLPHGLFDKTLGNSKIKTQPNQNASSTSSFGKKPSENRKLLSGDDKKNNPLFEDEDDEDKEEDSDDEWYIPNLIGIRKAGDFGVGGYQKVRPSTE